MINPEHKVAMANHEGVCETEAEVRIVNSEPSVAMAKQSDNQPSAVVAIPHPISPEKPRMKIKQSVLIACACLFLLPGESFADPDNATVRITNQTGKRVIYQFKWGADAQWTDFDLQHGSYRIHRKKYNPKGVPPPYINVATAGGFEGALFKPYKLNLGWDNKPRGYHFVVKNNNVDLISD